jgi:hypothetical protein
MQDIRQEAASPVRGKVRVAFSVIIALLLTIGLVPTIAVGTAGAAEPAQPTESDLIKAGVTLVGPSAKAYADTNEVDGVYFGSYKHMTDLGISIPDIQAGNWDSSYRPVKDNDAKPVKWYVLKGDDGKTYLYSKYILDVRRFDSNKVVGYADSELADYLQNTMAGELFADGISGNIIVPTDVETNYTAWCWTNPDGTPVDNYGPLGDRASVAKGQSLWLPKTLIYYGNPKDETDIAYDYRNGTINVSPQNKDWEFGQDDALDVSSQRCYLYEKKGLLDTLELTAGNFLGQENQSFYHAGFWGRSPSSVGGIKIMTGAAIDQKVFPKRPEGREIGDSIIQLGNKLQAYDASTRWDLKTGIGDANGVVSVRDFSKDEGGEHTSVISIFNNIPGENSAALRDVFLTPGIRPVAQIDTSKIISATEVAPVAANDNKGLKLAIVGEATQPAVSQYTTGTGIITTDGGKIYAKQNSELKLFASKVAAGQGALAFKIVKANGEIITGSQTGTELTLPALANGTYNVLVWSQTTNGGASTEEASNPAVLTLEVTDKDVPPAPEAPKPPVVEKPEKPAQPELPEQPEAPAPVVPGKVYSIVSANGPVLDIAGGSKASEANVQAWHYNATMAQGFIFEAAKTVDGVTYYTIKNVGSGKYLDIYANIAADGTNVWQYDGNASSAQLWTVEDAGNGMVNIRSIHGDFYLDLLGNGKADGTNVHIYHGNGTSAQLFELRDTQAVANGTYTLESAVAAGMVLDVPGRSTENSVPLQIYTANNTPAQNFTFTYEPATGYYTIKAECSDKFVDIAGASSLEGATVWQYEKNGTVAQRFALVPSGEAGQFTIHAATGAGVLDVKGANGADGTPVWTYAPNNTNAQLWTLR